MFGQAMATFIPPMLPGVVVFMRGYNPGDIVEQIRTRRVSVLVSVPKILDVLREHVAARGADREDCGPRRHRDSQGSDCRAQPRASRGAGGITATCIGCSA